MAIDISSLAMIVGALLALVAAILYAFSQAKKRRLQAQSLENDNSLIEENTN